MAKRADFRMGGPGMGRRRKLKDMVRIVSYLDPSEQEEIQEAADRKRISISAWGAEAMLRQARDENADHAVKSRRK